MKIFLKSLAALLFLALAVWAIRSDTLPDRAGAGGAGAASLPGRSTGDAAWRTAPVWDDGRAEYCAYDVTWARYGHLFAGSALLVVVKEPWAPDLDVKADTPRPDGFEVLKLNHIRDVRTGIYTYHQMASVFARRDDGTLRKINAASTEACGVSTALMTRGRLETHSYFDGQGDRATDYPAGALPEDGLPLFLRGYVTGAAPETLSLFPSLMHGAFPKLEPAPWRVEKRSLPAVETAAGPLPGVEIRLTGAAGVLAYTFAVESPHRLLRFERSDGTVYRMAKCERIPYWAQHNPGDESWWPARPAS
ncbi:MAG TPA: hypothetical protein DD490_08660 [Acidobacteria bacterium]|nr:hypothetical protein [Acidobacteriota bacterium]